MEMCRVVDEKNGSHDYRNSLVYKANLLSAVRSYAFAIKDNESKVTIILKLNVATQYETDKTYNTKQ
jgi:hypothetical protein